jgi:hypothetical protein
VAVDGVERLWSFALVRDLAGSSRARRIRVCILSWLAAFQSLPALGEASTSSSVVSAALSSWRSMDWLVTDEGGVAAQASSGCERNERA